MIFSHPPRNWKELQNAVCEVFKECGYNAESPKIVTTARSEAIEVDVYVEDNNISKQIIICECKLWNTNVPQAVVHAFRTQISDIGANAGFLITKKGFQTGAVSSAEYTNVKLLTWDEFESLYESTWYEKYFISQFNQICEAFIEYMDPINSRIFMKADKLSKERQLCFIKLREKHLALSDFFSFLSIYHYMGFESKMVEKSSQWNYNIRLPLKGNEKFSWYDEIPTAINEALSYKELLNEIRLYVNKAVSEFDEVFGERA